MGEKDFQQEVIDRLARIETNVANASDHKEKISNLEIQMAHVEASTKSAHHRLDTIKEDLTEAIKEQIKGVYRTAALLGGVAGFFVGIIMVLWKH